MKTQKDFKDLDKANAYVEQVNTAYAAEAEANKVNEAVVKKLTADISKAKDELLKVDGLKYELKATNAQVTTLEKELEKVGSVDIEALKKELQESNNLVADLGKQLETLSSITAEDKKVVQVEGKQYLLEGSNFIVPGKGSLTADQLAADDEALKVLLKRKSSALTLVK